MTHTHSKHSKIIDLRQVTLTELREAMEELKSNKPCRGGWAAEGNEKGGEMLWIHGISWEIDGISMDLMANPWGFNGVLSEIPWDWDGI